jgi:hypothetical protein
VELLFRRGFSLILDLRKEAQKLITSSEGGLENLGHPLAGMLNGLVQKRPYFAGNLLGETRNREFESMQDLTRIREMMDKAALEDSWEAM